MEKQKEPGRRLYVGNLNYRTSWQDLKDHFKTVGNVVYANVLKDYRGSKGCGIVEFSTAQEAQQAIKDLNDTTLDGRKIFVREDREEERSHSQIFVGNLSYGTSWQDLKDLFSQIGPIRHADVLRDYQGRSKGCGIVLFESENDAKEAIKKFHDTEFQGRKILVRQDTKA